MKKIALACLIVLAATLTLPPLSEARHHRHPGHHHGHRSAFHSRVVIGFGPSYYWGPHPYWYYPPPYAVYAPPPYVVYAPPPIVVQETPPVYVQQTPPPPPPPPAASEQFWYYCQSANGYYPAVPSCAEAWVKVAPRP